MVTLIAKHFYRLPNHAVESKALIALMITYYCFCASIKALGTLPVSKVDRISSQVYMLMACPGVIRSFNFVKAGHLCPRKNEWNALGYSRVPVTDFTFHPYCLP